MIEIFCLSLLIVWFIVSMRSLYAWFLRHQAANLIFVYNVRCWLIDSNDYIDYDEAIYNYRYILMAPWVITMRQCVKKEVWEKIKPLKGFEDEILRVATEEYHKRQKGLGEEVEEDIWEFLK